MNKFLVSSVAIAASIIPVAAWAQSSAPAPGEEGPLEEIIVTAQRRAENLQDVPVAVTALTESMLTAGGINSTQDLQVAVPGLVTHQSSNAFLPYIRGVGSNQAGNGNESSVAVYLDGVYQGVKASNVMELANIQRIEVLKGPQGTLFGRNATGGAINIVTRDPGSDPEISVSAGFGRFNDRRLRGYVAAPVTDTLSASIAFTGRWDDGYIHDIARDKDQAPVKSIVAMGKLKWQPTDEFTAILSGGYTYVNDPTFNSPHVLPGTVSTAQSLGQLVTHEPDEAAMSIADVYQRTAATRAGMSLSYDLGGVEVISTSGYVKTKGRNFLDIDTSTANLLHLSTGQVSEQFSQELQLQSRTSGPLTWIAGAYYFWLEEGFGKAPYDQITEVGLPAPVRPADLLVPGTLASGVNSLVTTDSKSLFAQATYEVVEGTRVTAGLRYTNEAKGVKGVQYLYTAVPGAPGSGVELNNGVIGNDGLVFGRVPRASMDLSTTWNRMTWRLAIDHKLSEDIMAYTSYSRGFKSGSYTPGQVNPLQKAVNPEILDAFEVGLKSELLDRRLRLNASAFYYDYSDIQIALVTAGGTSSVQNAAAAELFGLDIDFNAAPTDRLTIFGGLNLLKSKYKRYPNAQMFLPNVVGTPCSAPPRQIDITEARRLASLTPTGGNCVYSLNASGLSMVMAPKVTGNLGMEYELPLADGQRLVLGGSLYYNDGYDITVGGVFGRVKAFEELSASVTWHGADDRYFVRVWGENLTNDVHSRNIQPLGAVWQEVSSPPTRYGLTLGFKFGGGN